MNLENYLHKNNFRINTINVVYYKVMVGRHYTCYNIFKISELEFYFNDDFVRIEIYL